MKTVFFIISLYAFCTATELCGQQLKSDSIKVVKTMQELITICKTVDWADPKVSSEGTFYKAAPYIVYRGTDEARNWKAFANYSNPLEKKGVNEVCYRINSTVNQDSAYKIINYSTAIESEGTWHIVQVSYKKKGVEKKAFFAFLKIGDKFGLGDID